MITLTRGDGAKYHDEPLDTNGYWLNRAIIYRDTLQRLATGHSSLHPRVLDRTLDRIERDLMKVCTTHRRAK